MIDNVMLHITTNLKGLIFMVLIYVNPYKNSIDKMLLLVILPEGKVAEE
jgi:hypothetical protein